MAKPGSDGDAPSAPIDLLLGIMAALRTPGTGCPWDLEQDFSTIAPYTIEEAYEVADAIARGDMCDLKDELGDLLLQVVFHARMAEEAGVFDFNDVAAAISEKMIRRHPHVFGPSADGRIGADTVKQRWEDIKAVEKAERAGRNDTSQRAAPAPGLLNDVPVTFPALLRAAKLQKQASRVGFDWNDARLVLDKIEEEIAELRAELDCPVPAAAGIAEEVGDLLFALANLARHVKVNPEDALQRANRKFMHRFAAMEAAAAAAGTSLDNLSLDEMETLWTAAKAEGGPG